MTMHTRSTTDLLAMAEELTPDTLTAEDRRSWVDPDLASIIEALESRGYAGTWDHWVTTGTWALVREQGQTTAESIQQAWTAGYRREADERAEAEATSIDQDWIKEETRYTFADGSAWITSGPFAWIESREEV